jgi:ADP-heptose:LPS heptosyltransferase
MSSSPQRIILILPCCIGDVVLATATLQALRRAYPQAHITWAVGTWSRAVLEDHPLLDAILDTGSMALPVKSPGGFMRFVQQLRAGHYDLAVSLVRSPLMSLAVWLSRIPERAGLDSAGRGFGYTIRVPLDPTQPDHEARIYLRVAAALGLPIEGCEATVPVQPSARRIMRTRFPSLEPGHYLVLHPGGGENPGMLMTRKRWPPPSFADLAVRLQAQYPMPVVIVGGPQDGVLVQAVQQHIPFAVQTVTGLPFAQLAALAADSWLYIGNDTGMTHLAAAAGARTVMILGPTDPARYAPFIHRSLALWKPHPVDPRGVAAAQDSDWEWGRDGLSVEEAVQRIQAWISTV